MSGIRSSWIFLKGRISSFYQNLPLFKKFCLGIQQGIIQIKLIRQTHPIRKIVIKDIVDEFFRWDNPAFYSLMKTHFEIECKLNIKSPIYFLD